MTKLLIKIMIVFVRNNKIFDWTHFYEIRNILPVDRLVFAFMGLQQFSEIKIIFKINENDLKQLRKPPLLSVCWSFFYQFRFSS